MHEKDKSSEQAIVTIGIFKIPTRKDESLSSYLSKLNKPYSTVFNTFEEKLKTKT